MNQNSTTGGGPEHAPPSPTFTPFPYELVLAYCHGELAPSEAAYVAAQLSASARWRAHLDSIQYLALERVAAQHDAEALSRFRAVDPEPFCVEVARTEGEVFWELLDETRDPALGHTPREWNRHVDRCVYCRRMRRGIQARIAREIHGLPPGEPLLREWLLEHRYREVLDQVTVRLGGAIKPKPKWKSEPEPIGTIVPSAIFTATRDRALDIGAESVVGRGMVGSSSNTTFWDLYPEPGTARGLDLRLRWSPSGDSQQIEVENLSEHSLAGRSLAIHFPNGEQAIFVFKESSISGPQTVSSKALGLGEDESERWRTFHVEIR